MVVKGKDAVERLVMGSFAEGNQVARAAPVVIVACADPKDDAITAGQELYLFDVALAVENLLLAATHLGLATHLIKNVDEAKLKAILGLPENVRFVIATPLAYPEGGSYAAAAEVRLGQRTRKTLQEVVSWNGWGAGRRI